MALAVASVALETRRAPRVGAAWVAAGIAFWTVSTRLGLHGSRADVLTPATYLARHQLYTVIALALLLPAVFADRSEGRLRRMLDARALAFLGTVSYGIYLYHVPVLVKLGRLNGVPGTPAELAVELAIAIPVVVALAWASWRLVERPALALAARGRPGAGPDLAPEPSA
jgi:peptidoglycan/LPS O-acetylase OafA/YrhL